MRTLFGLLLLFAAVACNKNDDVPAEKPTIKKIEWQVHASDAYTDPWLDAMTAKVAIRIYKSDTVNQKTAIIWDTTFATRTIRQYPVLPQKHVIEKEILVRRTERLQSWYNIRYEMNGTASEMGHMQMVYKPFTFVDIRL